MNSHAKWLRQAATEIRAEGHNGWGNTCEQAAEEIDRLSTEGARLREALRLLGDTSDPGLPCYCDGGNHNPGHPTERCREIRNLLHPASGRQQ